MTKRKSLNTFSPGDKVKVDMGGSGLGIQFLTIKEGFETNNCNGYKDYTFEEEVMDDYDKKPFSPKVSEYYIRPIKPSDLKLKKLAEKTKAFDFEFDYDEVQKNFWMSQEENIESINRYINDFLHPYLTEYKHIVPAEKVVDWDSYYKKGMHTKNRYIFAIPHPLINIIVSHGTSHMTVFITAPSGCPSKWDSVREKSILFVCEIFVKYTDDEYTEKMKDLLIDVINKFDEGLKKPYYVIHPDYKKVNEVERYLAFLIRGDYNDWQSPIPGNYIYALRELNYLKHYLFNKGF